MSAPIKAEVKFGKTTLNVEIDQTQDVEYLKAQLASLTNVPVDRQKLLSKGKAIKTKADLEALKDGAKIMMMGSADALPAEPTAPIVFLEDMSEAQKLKLVPSAPSAGLKNLGNTCYMNATLQCLRAIPELKDALKSFNSAKPAQSGAAAGGNRPAADGHGALVKDLARLFTNMDSTSEPIVPWAFTENFRSIFPQFDEKNDHGHHKQQDADECLTQICTAMGLKLTVLDNLPVSSRSVGPLTPAEGPDPTAPPAKSAFHQLFGAEVTVTLTNTENDKEDKKVEVEIDEKLRCNIDIQTNYLHQGLERSMEEDLEKHSPTLGRNAVYRKVRRISRLPPVLTVQFVRFYWRNDTKVKAKIGRKVDFPVEDRLDVFPLCAPALKASLSAARIKIANEEEAKLGLPSLLATPASTAAASAAMDQGADSSAAAAGSPVAEKAAPNQVTSGYYELFAIVTHKGREADSGHYVGWVKKEDNLWLKFDDDVVSTVTNKEIKDLNGSSPDWHTNYLVFYRRVDDMTPEGKVKRDARRLAEQDAKKRKKALAGGAE